MIVEGVVFGVLAAAMAGSTAVFVRWAAESRSGLRESIVVFLLLMMTGMLAGALVYVLAPRAATAVAGLWVASAIMSAAVVLVFVAFVRAAGANAAPAPPAGAVDRPRGAFVASVIGLVVVNEFLMGWVLSVADGALPRSIASSPAGVLGWGSAVVVSPWFVFTMGAEMLITVALLRRVLPGPAIALLLAQGAIMFLSPPAFPASADSAALYAGSVAMVGLFVYLMDLLYRRRSLAEGLARYLARLLPVYAVMMLGVFLWTFYGNALLFAVAVLLEMVVFFDAVIRAGSLGGPASFAWQERPAWTTGVLANVFVSELFMGAALSWLLTPSIYSPGPLLGLAGPPVQVVQHAAANGFFFLANTVASTWFLLMMGAEMGALVVLRMREIRGRETRARLALMLGCYGAFAVFYPSLYYSQLAPHAPGAANAATVPVLGWSMGLGSAAVAPSAFAVIVATYSIFAGVTILFGRRAICSVFCTAATMYQGTTLDAMKSFNRTSPLARRYLGSRWSGAYRLTFVAVMVAFFGTALTSYLNSVGRWTVSVGGVDPSVFLFDLSFGVMWYVLFVTVPYAGEYNCVTMGWCYTGLLAGLSSRAGFFRLRVREKEVCRRCTTFDCARSCPVGLTDMPAAFRAKGEFRSSKCCGVGDCAEACPYGNLYLADVRHALFGRWLRAPASVVSGVRLPMAGGPAARLADRDALPPSVGTTPAVDVPPSS